MLFHLVYVSSAVHPMNDEELRDLLTKSRKNNAQDDLSGMLLYKDGNFVQVLEGDKEKVLALAAKIAGDDRHKNMMILLKGDIEQRAFDSWSMGFKNLTEIVPDEVPGYTDFLNLPLTQDTLSTEPNLAWKLLMLFKSTAR